MTFELPSFRLPSTSTCPSSLLLSLATVRLFACRQHHTQKLTFCSLLAPPAPLPFAPPTQMASPAPASPPPQTSSAGSPSGFLKVRLTPLLVVALLKDRR